MPVIVESNLPIVRQKFRSLAAGFDSYLRSQVVQLSAHAFGEHMTQVVKAHTPQSRIGSRSGGGPHLAETTQTDVKAFTSKGGSIATRQTKKIRIRQNLVPLTFVLQTGHAAPAQGIRPVNTKALFWPGLGHPVMFSRGGSAPPSPYAEDARREITGMAGPYWARVGEAVIQNAVKSLSV